MLSKFVDGLFEVGPFFEFGGPFADSVFTKSVQARQGVNECRRFLNALLWKRRGSQTFLDKVLRNARLSAERGIA